MTDAPDLQWSDDVAQATWIADRLEPFDSGAVTSVVPAGFEAYARLLHPADGLPDKPPARWAQVAAWSGVPLEADTQFHELAFPEHPPAAPAPWSGHMATQRTLDPADLDALLGVLIGYTATPECCWFCVWEGYGWDSSPQLTDPVPAAVRAGPRVRLPNRSHLLYRGPITDAWAFVGSQGQTPTLWWPDDRAWCVATEIDLAETYVGGCAALVARVVAEPRLEAQAVAPDASHHRRLQPWLASAIERAADELLATGEGALRTWRGTLRAQLQRPHPDEDGFLRIAYDGEDPVGPARSGSSWMRLHDYEPDGARLVAVVRWALANGVIDSLIA